MNGATTVRAGTSVRGDIGGAQDVIVEGRLVGAIAVEGDLVIRLGGVVRGPIRARHVRVEGMAIGSIDATVGISVADEARISGDLTAPSVEVEGRACVRGAVVRRPSIARTTPTVLWEPSPVRGRLLPTEPPMDLLPRVLRSSGRMRATP